jgi:hypothetical protein
LIEQINPDGSALFVQRDQLGSVRMVARDDMEKNPGTNQGDTSGNLDQDRLRAPPPQPYKLPETYGTSRSDRASESLLVCR